MRRIYFLITVLLFCATSLFSQTQRCGKPTFTPKKGESYTVYDTCNYVYYYWKGSWKTSANPVYTSTPSSEQVTNANVGDKITVLSTDSATYTKTASNKLQASGTIKTARFPAPYEVANTVTYDYTQATLLNGSFKFEWDNTRTAWRLQKGQKATKANFPAPYTASSSGVGAIEVDEIIDASDSALYKVKTAVGGTKKYFRVSPIYGSSTPPATETIAGNNFDNTEVEWYKPTNLGLEKQSYNIIKSKWLPIHDVVLTSTASLSTYNGNADKIKIDTLYSRGGIFYKDTTGTKTADNGINFQGNGCIWVRDFDISNGINIMWYGADSTGTKSSSQAINAAMLYAKNTKNGVVTDIYTTVRQINGATVSIPSGYFKIDSTINLYQNITLKGIGKFSSILFSVTSDTIIKNVSEPTNYDFSGGGIRDIGIFGSKSASTQQTGIALLRPGNFNMKDVVIGNCGGIGLYIAQGLGGSFDNIHIFRSNRHGLVIQDGFTSWNDFTGNSLPTNELMFNSCIFSNNDSAGIKIMGYVNGCIFTGGGAENNYNSSSGNVGYNVEITGNCIMPNQFRGFWTEGKCDAHYSADMLTSSVPAFKLIDIQHFGGTTVNRCVWLKKGVGYINGAFGHGGSYPTINGSNKPFRLTKANAFLNIIDCVGSTISDGNFLEDETGATTGLWNNSRQRNFEKSTDFYSYTGGNGDADYKYRKSGQSYDWLQLQNFYNGINFGDGTAAPSARLKYLATDWLGMDTGDGFQAAFLSVTRGGDISAASTIAPNGGIFNLTGSGTIDNITAPTSIFRGTITIIPTVSGIVFSTAGNIANSYTTIANVPLKAEWNGTKWYIMTSTIITTSTTTFNTAIAANSYSAQQSITVTGLTTPTGQGTLSFYGTANGCVISQPEIQAGSVKFYVINPTGSSITPNITIKFTATSL